MCQRRENEPWYSYAFRQVCEKPAAVLACAGLVAAGFLYSDLRALFREQTEAYKQVAAQLTELNVRISELELWHKMEEKR